MILQDQMLRKRGFAPGEVKGKKMIDKRFGMQVLAKTPSSPTIFQLWY
jgi:hypothetical protein